MTKIIAGRWHNIKTNKMEVIYAHLPIKMFIYCKWCGNIVSEKMYLIRSEEDMIPLEPLYSSMCKCQIDISSPM